jgi:prevent-host-death family protein
VPLAEAKNKFSALVARVEQGEEIAITRRGVPVVRLVPETQRQGPGIDRATVVISALQHLRELRADLVLEGDLRSIAREGLD